MYDECRVVNTALKNQLVSAFDNPYISMLKHYFTGYTMKTTMDLIQNLYANYDRISSTDMAANDKRLKSSYNAEESLEDLIKSLKECADFEAAAR